MKTPTLITLTTLVMIALPGTLAASEPEAKATKADKKSSEQDKIDSAHAEDATDTQDPTALAESLNALPEPPSMDALLAEGGGVPTESVQTDGGSNLGAGQGAGQGALALGFGLFLVGGGLGAGVMVARQKNRSGFKGMPAHHLKHVKSIRLSPKHQISLIEAQGKQLVVGITSAQMTLLASLDDPEELDAFIESKPDAPAKPTQNWNELFTSALQQRDAQMTSTPVAKPSRAPETPTSKPAEPRSEEAARSLPPVVKRTEVALRAETPESSAVVTETPDYTLEEEKVPRHDGMFAEHDAIHHSEVEEDKVLQELKPKTRRSRESDSMLIALAAMREEAAR